MTMDHDDIHPDDEATMAALGRALPRTPAPAGLCDRIALAAADGPAAPMAEVIPIGSRRRRTVLTSLAAAACAAALAVGATVWVMGGSDSPGPLTASTAVVAEAGERIEARVEARPLVGAASLPQVVLEVVLLDELDHLLPVSFAILEVPSPINPARPVLLPLFFVQ
jgi:hypothetical protein